jgi:isoquinoline 1-oxidoreductase alpha subunit
MPAAGREHLGGDDAPIPRWCIALPALGDLFIDAPASRTEARVPMPAYSLTLNGSRRTLEGPADMPLLWALRDLAGLTGTKFGCGAGVCGACTVREGHEVLRSCQLTLSEAAGRSFITIEGLAAAGGERVQTAWIEEDVAHCGYCQAGMLLAASALLERQPKPDRAAIEDALGANLCRCGSYPRIRRAMQRAIERAAGR